MAILAVIILVHAAPSAEWGPGSVCISPVREKPPDFSAPGLRCDSSRLSVKIEAQQPRVWTIRENVKIDSFDLTTTPRPMVFSNGEPQQSFKFRFSDRKSREGCLFINDLCFSGMFVGGTRARRSDVILPVLVFMFEGKVWVFDDSNGFQ